MSIMFVAMTCPIICSWSSLTCDATAHAVYPKDIHRCCLYCYLFTSCLSYFVFLVPLNTCLVVNRLMCALEHNSGT